MKMYGGVEVQIHAFLTLALDENEWPASRPQSLYPRNPLGGSQSRYGRSGEEKNVPFLALPGIEPRSSSP
jgi:hypothetical protein